MRLITALIVLSWPIFAQTADLGGNWIFTLTRYNEPELRRLKLEPKEQGFTGKLMGLDLKVSDRDGKVEMDCAYKENEATKSCGKLTGTGSANEMKGAGKFFDQEVTWSAVREKSAAAAPQRREFVPSQFHRQFNGNTPAALNLNPGDTVHTTTVDAGGVDEKGAHRSMGGNPLTGPFYIEGALPGDTLVVRLNRVRLNRDTAGISNDSIVAGAVDPYYAKDMKPAKDFDSSWKLDASSGYAQLSKPTDRLKNLRIRLQPMIGCIGVAPPNRQAFQSGYLGRYGGNMDYNQIREGTTVYLPVFQPGALLFVGDGHAVQGDGELTGNALETSMEVEFTVDLIRGKSIGQPRFENDEYVMVSGIAGSLNDALQMATTGISRWLEQEHKLNVSEIAMILATSMRYDIAEVVDPQVHLVAKLPKSILAQIEPKTGTE